MKKIILILICAVCCAGEADAQFNMIDKAIKVVRAGVNTTKAITLSDSDVRKLSRQFREQLDSTWNMLPPDSAASVRLANMTEKVISVDGTTLNFGVFDMDIVNAFAFGDGSIRITTALMDVMDDSEILAIIGHELGHIAGKDTKEAMKSAYYNAAIKDAAGLISDEIVKFTQSDWMKLADAFTNAQFSQKQELAADDYAFQFCLDRGVDPYAMHNALNKLVKLSEGEKSSTVAQMFASHPDSELRAKRMKKKADEYTSR